MADVIKTIGASGADYTTLAAFWTARNSNAGSGDVYIAEIIDAADYVWGEVTGTFAGSVKIRPATGLKINFENFSAAHAKIVSAATSALYYRSLAPLTIEDIELHTTGAFSGLRVGAFEDTNVTVQRCLLRGGVQGVSHGRDTATTLIENCVVTGASQFGIANGTSSPFAGITTRNTVVVGNNTSNTASRGGMRKDKAGTVIDNVVCYGNGLIDFFGASTTATVSYLASGDTSASGSNAITGVTSAAFTNYASEVYTAAAAGVLDGTAAGGADRGLNLSTADIIAITSPTDWALFARNKVTNTGSIAITGTYSGGTVPTSIEARWSGGTWTTITASPAAGAFSGSLTGLTSGNGTLEVRYSNATAIADSVDNVAIGAKFLFWGQSNFSGRATNPQSYTGTAGFFHKYTVTNNVWAQGADPFDTDTADGSLFPLLANSLVTELGCPVAFIGVASGSTTLAQWQSGQTLNTRMLNYITAAGADGLEGICSWIGESDASAVTSESDFKTRYNAVIDQLETLTGTKNMLVAISGLSNTDYANVRQWINDIAAANANASTTVPQIWPLYQKIHYESDTETADAAEAVFDGIVASFYSEAPTTAAITYDIGEIVFASAITVTAPVLQAEISYDIGQVTFAVSFDISVPVIESTIAYDIGQIDWSVNANVIVGGNVASVAYDIGAIDYAISASVTVPVFTAAIGYDVGAIDYSASIITLPPAISTAVSYDIGAIDYSVSFLIGPPPANVTASISYDIGAIGYAVVIINGEISNLYGVGSGITFTEAPSGVQF